MSITFSCRSQIVNIANGEAKAVYFIILKEAQYYTLQVQEYKKNNLFLPDYAVLFVCLLFFSDQAFPIDLYWQKYQSQMLEKLKSLRTGITIAERRLA